MITLIIAAAIAVGFNLGLPSSDGLNAGGPSAPSTAGLNAGGPSATTTDGLNAGGPS